MCGPKGASSSRRSPDAIAGKGRNWFSFAGFRGWIGERSSNSTAMDLYLLVNQGSTAGGGGPVKNIRPAGGVLSTASL